MSHLKGCKKLQETELHLGNNLRLYVARSEALYRDLTQRQIVSFLTFTILDGAIMGDKKWIFFSKI